MIFFLVLFISLLLIKITLKKFAYFRERYKLFCKLYLEFFSRENAKWTTKFSQVYRLCYAKENFVIHFAISEKRTIISVINIIDLIQIWNWNFLNFQGPHDFIFMLGYSLYFKKIMIFIFFRSQRFFIMARTTNSCSVCVSQLWNSTKRLWISLQYLGSNL